MADTQSSYKIVASGKTASVTPGTAVQLNGGTSLGCRTMRICAPAGNKGPVVLGDSTTKATSGATIGVELAPGQSMDFPVNNANLLYMDAQNSGDLVSWTLFKQTQ